METADPTVRALRRLLEMQSAASHGMASAAMMDADPAESAFISEELERMDDIRHLLTTALGHIESGDADGFARPLLREVDALRGPTPWADSDLLDRLIATYAGED